MASRIWCARVVHEVEESRSDIVHAITNIRRERDPRSPDVSLDITGEAIQHAPLLEPPGFVYVTRIGSHPPHQVLLNIDHISSIEAVPGDPI